MQDVALWHERDISHSSAERVILPDSSMLAYYVAKRMTTLIERLEVLPDRMLANIENSLGLVFSQPTLLALVAGGMLRDDAYRIVQSSSMKAMEENRQLRDVLAENPDVTLSAATLDELFDLRRAIRNADRVFNSIDKIAL